MSYRFPLGLVVTSPGVRTSLTKDQLVSLLRRHAGDLKGNGGARAEPSSSRALSAFLVAGPDGRPETLWIVTDENRTTTLVMFPRESAYRASDLEEVPGPLLHEPLW